MISTFTALFDANVLFGARLRSLLMEFALSGLFRARWSNEIHEEWIAAIILKRPDIPPAKLAIIRSQMDAAVPDALVTGHEGLISSLDLPDTNDRHVLAAAIVGRASVIVTFNEQDFPPEALKPFGLHTRHPDVFLMEAEGIDPGTLIEAAARDLEHYVNPKLSVDEYLDGLRKNGVPNTANYLTRMRVLLENEEP